MTIFWQAGMRTRRWFIAALLCALASALVPALMHSGPPASRMNGSAFDPTTTAVALRGRAQNVVRIAAPGNIDDKDAGAQAQPAALPPPPFAGGRPRPAPRLATPAPFIGGVPPAGRWPASAQPRAPPALG